MCGMHSRVQRNEVIEVDRQHFLPVLANGKLSIGMHDLDAGIADQDIDDGSFGDHPALHPRAPAPRSRHPSRRPRRCRPPLRFPQRCSRAASTCRSATATFAPSPANRAAIALPMPLAAPVTIQTLFSSFMINAFPPIFRPGIGGRG